MKTWRVGDRFSLTIEGEVRFPPVHNRTTGVVTQAVMFEGSGFNNAIHRAVMEKATFIAPPYTPKVNDMVQTNLGYGIVKEVVVTEVGDHALVVTTKGTVWFVGGLVLQHRPLPATM